MLSQKDKDLAFVVLIGGKSSRFGSDKGIFEFQGKPLVLYLLETLLKFEYDIFLIANSQKQVQSYHEMINITKNMIFILDDYELISDKDLRSPMIGFYSAFKKLISLNYKKALTLSCDSPLIKSNVVKLLIKKSEGFDCCIPKWKNNFLEPLFAIYPIKETLKIAKENIINHTYKLINLLDKNWKVNYLSVENDIKNLDEMLLSFININGAIDIEKLIKVYKK